MMIKGLWAASTLFLAAGASAQITTYSDFGDFEAAAGTTSLFDFNSTPDGSFEGTSYDVGPFTLTGDTDPFADLEVFGGQVFADVCGVTVCAIDFGYSITFDAPITAFGAQYDSGILAGSGIDFTVGGNLFAGPAPTDGFFGFVSDTPFTSILVSGDDEIHQFDDVRFASALSAVPESSTWAMLIAGFAILGGIMRRRKLVPGFA